MKLLEPTIAGNAIIIKIKDKRRLQEERRRVGGKGRYSQMCLIISICIELEK